MHYLVAHKGFVFVSLTLVVIEINLIKGQCYHGHLKIHHY